MTRTAALHIVLGCALFLLAPGAGRADETQPSRFTLTFTERVRQETWDNTLSLSEDLADSTSWVRFRTSLMGQWRPSSRLELAARLTNENRYYLAPKSDVPAGKDFSLNEVFFDYFYIRWRNPWDWPLTLTLGRQDLMLGEGFVIFDGGPLDGSRSAYFNAARLDCALSAKNTLTFFYCYQPQTDTLLPILNDQNRKMVEQDEEGFGLYFAGGLKRLGLEGYVFRKNMRRTESAPASGINVVGARVVAPLAERLSLTSEGALQVGRFGDQDRLGIGGHFHLDYATESRFPLPALLTLGGIHLSGDDASTSGTYEAWDPSFSRWPKWSESLIYIQGRETGRPALWTNFVSLYGGATFNLSDTARLNLTVHKLAADETTLSSDILSGSGRDRGTLFLAKLTYEVSKHVSGHFLWESLSPGNYYFAGARSYAWVRFEVLVRY